LTDDRTCVVQTAPSRRAAEEAGLVLTALAIAHVVEGGGGVWQVRVASIDEARARHALDEVAREATRAAPADVPARPLTLAGVHVALLLALVYLWSGSRAARSPMFTRGEADARTILGGEWWRTVTALTLHGDGEHLLGNAVFGALFVGALGAALGTGTALWVTLLAGSAGNLLNAWVRAPLHQGIGASTAIFGAVGALSGVAFVVRRGARTARAWVTFGAGLALLAMLGSSAETDVGAHLAGFAAGVPLGMGAARLPRFGAGVQLALSLAALAAVTWAWRLAQG
jgi:membrane associated rhomboid family serine protease